MITNKSVNSLYIRFLAIDFHGSLVVITGWRFIVIYLWVHYICNELQLCKTIGLLWKFNSLNAIQLTSSFKIDIIFPIFFLTIFLFNHGIFFIQPVYSVFVWRNMKKQHFTWSIQKIGISTLLMILLPILPGSPPDSLSLSYPLGLSSTVTIETWILNN